ncbi:MAG: FkbM family methyltransferase [Polyangiaceae bacterium]
MSEMSTERGGRLSRAVEDARLALRAFRCFEPYDAAKVLLLRGLGRSMTTAARVRKGSFRLALRPTDSDLLVAAQVFAAREYALDRSRTEALRRLAASWRAEGITPVIVDAGANVGCSSLFFADTYPDAEVVALEPDPATFEVLLSNARERPNIVAHTLALWSDDAGVELQDGGDRSWSTRVTKSDGRGLRIPSRTLDQVVASVPNGRLLIAKIDIEGAEREACGASIELLRNTPCIVIEPHDWMLPGHGSLQPLMSAVVNGNYDVLLRGENMFFVRCELAAPPA